MDFEKLTERARGFLQAAQTIAVREHHQRIAPAHLLKALLEDEQGMASGLIQAAGGDAKRALAEVDTALSRVPAVTGSGAQQAPGLDNDSVRLLDSAEQIAGKAGAGAFELLHIHLDAGRLLEGLEQIGIGVIAPNQRIEIFRQCRGQSEGEKSRSR